jgi:hypothetical protein
MALPQKDSAVVLQTQVVCWAYTKLPKTLLRLTQTQKTSFVLQVSGSDTLGRA